MQRLCMLEAINRCIATLNTLSSIAAVAEQAGPGSSAPQPCSDLQPRCTWSFIATSTAPVSNAEGSAASSSAYMRGLLTRLERFVHEPPTHASTMCHSLCPQPVSNVHLLA